MPLSSGAPCTLLVMQSIQKLIEGQFDLHFNLKPELAGSCLAQVAQVSSWELRLRPEGLEIVS
jgi:hypothetical protein